MKITRDFRIYSSFPKLFTLINFLKLFSIYCECVVTHSQSFLFTYLSMIRSKCGFDPFRNGSRKKEKK